VTALAPGGIRAKSENPRTVEGEKQCFSAWRVVDDDRFLTEFNDGLFERKAALAKNPSSDIAHSRLT
jgi:hypothetical protein